MEGTWDLGTPFEVDPLFLVAMRSLRLLFLGLMSSRLPLLQRCYLDGQSLELGREHLSAYQARPQYPRCELLEPFKSHLLQSEFFYLLLK